MTDEQFMEFLAELGTDHTKVVAWLNFRLTKDPNQVIRCLQKQGLTPQRLVGVGGKSPI